MTDEPPRPPLWGKGRVAFVARLDTIRSELGQGLSLTAIYDRHKIALGIGYSAFIKLVRRHAADAKPLKRRAASAMASSISPAPPPPFSPVTSIPEAHPHARHQSADRPGFKHHGIVQEGEPEQLFGRGFLPKRRG